ncbi:MAG: 50S ribosomal protein L29 [Armatimonadota bacterium]
MRQSEFKKKVKEATDAELESMLKQEREGLYKLRQQLALKQLDNPHAIKMARKNVARILTEMRLRRAGHSRG